MSTPDVSVVVIVYNDAANLATAVRSVLEQSLDNLEVIVVDDASTDDSAALADRLAEHPKVRVIHLPENSGGCSRPRNVGIDAARGTYVMFLDSDDVLDRHACRNLVLAAEEASADFSAGLCVRDHVTKNKTTRWYAWLYTTRAEYSSLRENPDLLYDTLSTNKCYRRSFLHAHGLRFPEGLHYEDLVFSTRAYLAAEKFVLIPNVVYRWKVVETADNPSITNRRYEFGNFVDRVKVHRIIDRMLLERGWEEVKAHKDAKFLKHDIRLYLNDFPYRDAPFQRRFLELAAEYLASLHPEATARAGHLPSIAAFMIRQRDQDGLTTAVDYLNHGRKLSTDLVLRDERVYWTDRYLDTAEGRAVLDVTALGLHHEPHRKLHFYNKVIAVGVDGSRLTLSGEITNQLDRIPAEGFSLAIAFRSRRTGGSRRSLAPVGDFTHLGSRVAWQVTLDLREVVRPIGVIDPVWDVTMRLRVPGRDGPQDNYSPLSVARAQFEGFQVPIRPRLGPAGGDHLESYITLNGNLAFRLVALGPVSTAVRWAGHQALATRPGRSARRRAGQALRGMRRLRTDAGFRAAVYRRLLARLPIRKGTVVFESHLGRHYSDNPRFIYEELRRRGLPYEAIWSYATSPAGFPPEASRVRRHSWAHLLALARAEFWVDNQGMPALARKRRGTTYLQTWHGTALKRMGHDMPAVKRGTGAARLALQQQVDRWDHFLVRCEHDVETLVRAYRFRGEVLRYGYPRNDVLAATSQAAPDQEAAAKLRAALRGKHDLPAEATLVLYAPTFRETHIGGRRAFDLRVDLDRLDAELGQDVLLLVRPHYLDTFDVAARRAARVRDVSAVPDVSELLACVDVLVTDYSSVMFDFAVTRRPMIFYTFDYEEYARHERGTYFDLSEVAPGPLVSTGDELIEAIREVNQWAPSYAEAYDAFVKRFAEYDDGQAARRIVDRFFDGDRGSR